MEEATTLLPSGLPDRFWFQKKGLEFLVENSGRGGLAFPPGAGKTRVLAEYMSLLARARPEVETRVLVVCTLASLYQWPRQLKTYVDPRVSLDVEVLTGTVASRWQRLLDEGVDPSRSAGEPLGDGPRLRVRVIALSSFSGARTTSRSSVEPKTARKNRTRIVSAVARWGGDLLVVDESHHVKAPSGVGGRLLRTVAQTFPRRVIMTGTLMPKGYEDLWGQFTVIEPDAFRAHTGTSSWTAFKNRYLKINPWSYAIEGYRHTDELEDVTKRLVLSVSEDEARAGRPEVVQTVVPFELSAKERRAYEKLRRQLAIEIGDATSVPPSAMVLSLRLRQLASGFLGMDDGTVEETGTSRVDAVCDLIWGELLPENRVLAFGEFLHDVEGTAARLRRAGEQVFLITGATSLAEREQVLEAFASSRTDRMIVVAQVSTLGESVNELVYADNGVMISPMWDRGKWIQALGRLDRTGRKRPGMWWLMEAQNTIDGRVYGKMGEKDRLENALLEECRAER